MLKHNNNNNLKARKQGNIEQPPERVILQRQGYLRQYRGNAVEADTEQGYDILRQCDEAWHELQRFDHQQARRDWMFARHHTLSHGNNATKPYCDNEIEQFELLESILDMQSKYIAYMMLSGYRAAEIRMALSIDKPAWRCCRRRLKACLAVLYPDSMAARQQGSDGAGQLCR